MQRRTGLILGTVSLVLLILSGCIYVMNVHPIASFTADPPSGTTPLSVSFDASASYDRDGTIDDYSWDFGDGQTASLIVPTTTNEYTVQTVSQVFTVVLTVTDNSGANDTTVRNVTVNP